MSQHDKEGHFPVPAQGESDVTTLLKRIQQQLGFLEKKIDTLLSQSQQPQERPFKKSFSRPFRPSFGQSHRPGGEGNRDRGPRERSFAPGRPFDRNRGPENRRFSEHKKPFFQRRKDRG